MPACVEREQACQRAQDLSLSAGRAADQPAQPRLVRRYHLHPDAQGLPVSGGNHGQVHPKGLALPISNTLEAGFCLWALNEANHQFGPPEIMNANQGPQFPSFD